MTKFTENNIYSIENAMRRYKAIEFFIDQNTENFKTIKDAFEMITRNITTNVIEHDFLDKDYKFITFDDNELRFTVFETAIGTIALEDAFEVYDGDSGECIYYFDNLREAGRYVDAYYANLPENTYEPDPYDEYMDRKLEEKEWN